MVNRNKKKYWYRFLSLNQIWVKFLVASCLVVLFLLCSVIVYYHTQAAEYDLSVMDKKLNEHALYSEDRRYLGGLSRHSFLVATREQLPDNLIKALIAREDNHFYDHSGIDYFAIARSLIRNVKSMRYKQGGSTITMQLARNLFELRDRTMNRKLLEVSIARRLEKEFAKDRILVEYLNRIYYGCSVYGIANAARFYFGKRVEDLDLVECATLIGLIRGPSLFNPVNNMNRARAVRDETLSDMLDMEFITPEQYEQALKAPIIIRKAEGEAPPASYPLMAVENILMSLTSNIKNSTPEMSIHSFFDVEIQHYVEREVSLAMEFIEGSGIVPEAWIDLIALTSSETRAAIAQRLKNLKKVPRLPRHGNSMVIHGLQCAVLIVDGRKNRKGNVLAISSGRGSWDGLDRWQLAMQPGRAVNPFLFSLACQSNADQSYIIANRPEQTGQLIGYSRVSEFFQKIHLSDELPSEQDSARLYTGLYPVKRINLARLTYCLLHRGMDIPFRFVQAVYSHSGAQLYRPEAEPITELIRRESAYIAKELPPFRVSETKPLSMNVTLPQNGGQWAVMSSMNELSVFVWIGLDDTHASVASHPRLRSRLAYVAPLLTEQLYQYASQQLRAQRSKITKNTSMKK